MGIEYVQKGLAVFRHERVTRGGGTKAWGKMLGLGCTIEAQVFIFVRYECAVLGECEA
jgi:hypothetical protein